MNTLRAKHPFLLLSFLVFFFSMLAPLATSPSVYANKVDDGVKKHCKQKNKGTKNACEKGYRAGYNDKSSPCNGLKGTEKSACSLAYQQGKKDKKADNKAKPPETSSYTVGASTSQCNKGFFGLVPWYKYIRGEFKFTEANLTPLNGGSPCEIKCFNVFAKSQPNDCGQKGSDIPYVLLAIVDNLLRIAGIVSVAFIIVGAIRYITSQGNPEDTAGAQSTIINALVGLAVSIVAVAFISFIGNSIR